MSAIREASGLSTIAGISVRDGSGLATIATGSIRDGSGLSVFFSSNGSGGGGSNALSPDEVTGFGYSKTPIAITTQAATVNAPSGATIVWHFAPPDNWSAVNPGNATTEFRRTNVAAGDEDTTQVTATVTNGGNSYTTNAIMATVTNTFG